MDSKKLIAHRGDNTHYPENTLIAIEAALKAGAVAFEFDVQMNADHSLVAFHDAYFTRMTEANQDKIFDLTDLQMAQISIHEPSKFGDQHKPMRVSHIDVILDLLKRYPNSKAYVEIKEESINHWGLELVMSELIKSLKGYEKQATIISFSERALVYTKKHSKLEIGLVFRKYNQSTQAFALELKPEYLICSYKILPSEKLWQGNWQWMIYTVNDLALAKKLSKRTEIDFIETDDIQLLLNG